MPTQAGKHDSVLDRVRSEYRQHLKLGSPHGPCRVQPCTHCKHNLAGTMVHEHPISHHLATVCPECGEPNLVKQAPGTPKERNQSQQAKSRSTASPVQSELEFAAAVRRGSPYGIASGCSCGVCNYPLDSQQLHEHKPSNTLMAVCPECGRATVCEPVRGTTLGRYAVPIRSIWGTLGLLITGAVIGPVVVFFLLFLIRFLLGL